jgi:hypothetical protein
MERSNKFACPHCGASLKSARGVRIGRTIKCPQCAAPFTVRPEDAEEAAGVNPGRLLVALLAALLYLSGGAILAVYCFSQNAPAPERVRVKAAGSERKEAVPEPAPPPPALPPAGLVTVSTAEQRRIDDAIALGVWFLKDRALPAGGWNDTLPVGHASLAGLTLLECGVPASDAVVQNAAKVVRTRIDQLGTNYDTYQRALAILFLDRLGEYRDRDLIRYLAVCLISGQHPTIGAWHYNDFALDKKEVPKVLAALADRKQSLADWHRTAVKGDTPDNWWNGWDNSNTQFALLALWVARRHGVPIDKCVALAEKHFRDTQLPSGPDPAGTNLNLDGSWYYDRGQNSSKWPSMTCAGLLGLAIGHGVAVGANKKALDDPAVQRAFAMLAREIDRPGEKRDPDLYFLWSLERVGVLYEMRKIGDKDWYAWGRKVLLDRQDQNDGSWKDGGYYGNNPILDTSFALLFLKQANLAEDLTPKLRVLQKK